MSVDIATFSTAAPHNALHAKSIQASRQTIKNRGRQSMFTCLGLEDPTSFPFRALGSYDNDGMIMPWIVVKDRTALMET